MIEALIFDMDGVLIDSMHLHAKAWKLAFEDVGISIDEREIFALEGENDPGIVKTITDRYISECYCSKDVLASIPARKHELFNKDSATMFEGVDICLRSLKKRFRLAVVSGSDRNIMEMVMERYFPGIFDTIVSGDDTIQGKPAPDPYERAVEMLNTDKENCIVVENAILGVESALNAGIFTIGIPTYLDRKELSHADIVLQDHRELFRLLQLLQRF